LLRILETMSSGLPKKQPFRCKKISRDWITEDSVSTNCGCPNRIVESP